MRYIITLLAVLIASAVGAVEVPIPPDAVLLHQGPCRDSETEQDGFCQLGRTPDGTIYMLFYQDQRPIFLRRVTPGQPYETIWQSDAVLGMAL